MATNNPLVSFQELPSINIDVSDTTTPPTNAQNSDQPIATGGTARAVAQVTAMGSNALMLVPSQDSPLLLRHMLISDDSQPEDNISTAIEQFKTAMKEVERAGKHLQECVASKNAQSVQEVLDCRQKQELCREELKEYKDKCTQLEECEKKLRQCYQTEITSLEKDVVKLQNEKEDDHNSYATELESLKLQHNEETKDLQHTIKLQANQCRMLDLELKELKSDYAEKEKYVANLREELETKQRELEELGLTVKKKEEDVKAIKKDFCEKNDFTTSEILKSLLLEKERFQEKLKTCEGISELVSRLPNVNCQEERDEITKEVMKKLGQFSRRSSAKKSKSWHSTIN